MLLELTKPTVVLLPPLLLLTVTFQLLRLVSYVQPEPLNVPLPPPLPDVEMDMF